MVKKGKSMNLKNIVNDKNISLHIYDNNNREKQQNSNNVAQYRNPACENSVLGFPLERLS